MLDDQERINTSTKKTNPFNNSHLGDGIDISSPRVPSQGPQRSKSELALKDILSSGSRNTTARLSEHKFSHNLSVSRSQKKLRKDSSQVSLLSVIEHKLFEPYSERLQKIFQFYCSYGDPLNKTKMKSIKFVKLLKESGLLQVN